jgi:cytidine deaminase
MKKRSVSIDYFEFDNLQDLKPEDRELLEKAHLAAANAYAPYSGFFVGAAVKLENGIIIPGNNQENAAYPSGLCAERVALFTASAQYPGIPVTDVAITAKSGDFMIDYPVTPCGACRQVMSEYEFHHKKPIRVILAGESGKVHVYENIDSLLPFRFDSTQLKHKR